MADNPRPGMLEWYASQGKRGAMAEPQSYRQWEGEQEPGYGADPDLRTMYAEPGWQMFGSGLGALTKGAAAVGVAANAPWWAKPVAAVPGTMAAGELHDFLRAYQQTQGQHPTQDYQRQWQMIIEDALRRLPNRK